MSSGILMYLYPAELRFLSCFPCFLKICFPVSWGYRPNELAWARGPMPAWSISQRIAWSIGTMKLVSAECRAKISCYDSTKVWMFYQGWELNLSLRFANVKKSLRLLMSLYMYNRHYASEDWSKTDDIDESWSKDTKEPWNESRSFSTHIYYSIHRKNNKNLT